MKVRIKKTLQNITENTYIFSVIAKIISIITGLIYSILFARYLGPELRGTASIILNYSEIISLILCLGIYQAYPYFRKEREESIYMEYINYVFGLFLIYLIMGILLCLTGIFSINIVISIILAPVLMGIKQLNYVVLIENPKLRNTANIKLDLFDIIFLFLLLIFTKANYSLCILFLIIKHLFFFVIAIANLKVNIFKIHPTLKGVIPYIKYGITPMITVILMEINYKVDVIMLERFKIAAADIGIYSLGVMLAQKLWMIPDALKDILLSNLAKGKNHKEVSKITRISLAVTICMVIGMSVLGKPLIFLMYGSEYEDAYLITLIIFVGVIGMVFYKMVYSYNVVNGHKTINLIFLAVTASLNILINAVTIPYTGMFGAALASLISCSICGLMFLLYFCKTTGTPIQEMMFLTRLDIQLMKSIIKSGKNR